MNITKIEGKNYRKKKICQQNLWRRLWIPVIQKENFFTNQVISLTCPTQTYATCTFSNLIYHLNKNEVASTKFLKIKSYLFSSNLNPTKIFLKQKCNFKPTPTPITLPLCSWISSLSSEWKWSQWVSKCLTISVCSFMSVFHLEISSLFW